MTLCRVNHPGLSTRTPPPPRALPAFAIRQQGVLSGGLPLLQVAPWSQYFRPAFQSDSDAADYADQEGWYYLFSCEYELTGIAVLGLSPGDGALESGLNHYWATPESIHLITSARPRPIYTARVRMRIPVPEYTEPGEPLVVTIPTALSVVEVAVQGSPYPEGDGIGRFQTSPPNLLTVYPVAPINPSEQIEVTGFLRLIPRQPVARVCLFSRPQYYHCDYFEWIGHMFSEVSDPLRPVPFDLAWNRLTRTATLYLPPRLSVPRRKQSFESVVATAWQSITSVPRVIGSSADWLYPPQPEGIVENPVLAINSAAESAIKAFTSVLLKTFVGAESAVRVTIARTLDTFVGSESSANSQIARTISSVAASESGFRSTISRVLITLPASESTNSILVESKRIAAILAASESYVDSVVSYGFRLLVGSESSVSIAIARTSLISAAAESGVEPRLPRTLAAQVFSESSAFSSLGRSLLSSAASESSSPSAIARVASISAASESTSVTAITRIAAILAASESYVLTRPLSGQLGGDLATWLLATRRFPTPNDYWNVLESEDFAQMSSAIAQILSTEVNP